MLNMTLILLIVMAHTEISLNKIVMTHSEISPCKVVMTHSEFPQQDCDDILKFPSARL